VQRWVERWVREGRGKVGVLSLLRHIRQGRHTVGWVGSVILLSSPLLSDLYGPFLVLSHSLFSHSWILMPTVSRHHNSLQVQSQRNRSMTHINPKSFSQIILRDSEDDLSPRITCASTVLLFLTQTHRETGAPNKYHLRPGNELNRKKECL
jgi:hypothetical protein